MRKYMLQFGAWLIRKSGYHVQVLAIEPRLFAAARLAVAEAERVGAGTASGLFKRQTAMQVLSNFMPEAPEHDCANAIQVALEHERRS